MLKVKRKRTVLMKMVSLAWFYFFSWGIQLGVHFVCVVMSVDFFWGENPKFNKNKAYSLGIELILFNKADPLATAVEDQNGDDEPAQDLENDVEEEAPEEVEGSDVDEDKPLKSSKKSAKKAAKKAVKKAAKKKKSKKRVSLNVPADKVDPEDESEEDEEYEVRIGIYF